MTVMLCGASSSAQVRLMPIRAALVALYAVRFGLPNAAREEIFTTRPMPACCMPGIKACRQTSAAFTFKVMAWFMSAMRVSAMLVVWAMAALLTSP